jgi:predicted protein tyrosine phosphatase
MKNKGIEVIVGILEKESRELNKRFFTFHKKNRPYVILKWAESKDGFIDAEMIYLLEKQKHPYGTDVKYLIKGVYNIIANKIRGE